MDISGLCVTKYGDARISDRMVFSSMRVLRLNEPELFMTTHLDRGHRVVHRPEEILLSDVGQQTFQTRFEVVLFREAEGRDRKALLS